VPTYQYACTECGEQLEMVQKFTDEPLTECLVCSGRLRKVFSPVGIVFKGSGFYRTDSRSGNGTKDDGRKEGAASEPASAGSGSKTEGSGDKSEGSGDKGDKSDKDKKAAASSSSKGSSPGPSPAAASSGSTGEKVA
jgi:putative FmdB family regulatory protein